MYDKLRRSPLYISNAVDSRRSQGATNTADDEASETVLNTEKNGEIKSSQCHMRKPSLLTVDTELNV